ncbi:MAG: biotin/lipoyl-binding carrier protein [Propionibacteriaceae bacterium]|nr:biotin/lipoyl-binding carrier protein [Micropruina sp.]HBX80926.1 acetyl-CoA carboxylase biotin carboxyl carrier protein subunit [Propionibacteriaceae bacterium]HBY22571.1 acetyl-CoA carboxylase biotin carboxyl carrier protein subunit [Propionibacteriaceae bacterium]
MSHVVIAELVANVLSVDVEVGQVLEAGAQCVVLESMKMEIPVLTEYAGVVTEVVVKVGDVVRDGDPMVILDRA